jgi:hypothetical protein
MNNDRPKRNSHPVPIYIYKNIRYDPYKDDQNKRIFLLALLIDGDFIL